MNTRPALLASLFCAAGMLLAAGASAPAASAPQSAPASQPTAPLLTPFANLPAPATRASVSSPRISEGTPGLLLPPPPAAPGRTSIVLLGDLYPAAADTSALLASAAAQINLLQPDLVLTTGNLVPGLTRQGATYLDQLHQTLTGLQALKAPWYPCVGERDVVSGTRLAGAVDDPAAGDRRFEDLYRRYVGPLYYSLDVGSAAAEGVGASGGGGVHVIVLDSEEGVGAGSTLSDSQLRWLRNDLKRTFDAGKMRSVIVLLHRPLWRDQAAAGAGTWAQVHTMLVEFNRLPFGGIENMGGALQQRPQVLGVFAAGERAYSQDPPRDGIRYTVLGPLTADPRPHEALADTLRHFTLLKFDASGDMHVALVQFAPESGQPALLPENAITQRERSVLDALAAWTPASAGIEGIIDEHGDPLGRRLTFHATSILPETVEVQLRLSPGAAAAWEFVSPPLQRRLARGASASYEFSLRQTKPGTLTRPVAEIVARWADPAGTPHEVVLPRAIAISPAVEVPVAAKPLPLTPAGAWPGQVSAIATPWTIDAARPARADPVIHLAADDERVLVHVQVADPTVSYWPVMTPDARWGGIASDAVEVSWAVGEAGREKLQHVWIVPGAPRERQAWGALGAGTDLVPVDPAWDLRYETRTDRAGYAVAISLPRKLLCGDSPAATAPATQATQPVRLGAARLNIAVHDNEEGAMTWTKSWAPDPPAAWARVEFVQALAATAPATSK